PKHTCFHGLSPTAERASISDDVRVCTTLVPIHVIDCLLGSSAQRHARNPTVAPGGIARSMGAHDGPRDAELMGARFQCAVQPPSIGSAAPVIEAAASLARKTASAPISSTVANFLFGCCASNTSRTTCSREMA